MTGEHGRSGEGAPADRTKIERLHDIAADMMACRTESDVYQLTVAAAERVLAFDICGVDAVEDGHLVPKAVSAEMADVGYERSTVEAGGLAGEAYRTGESIVTDDVRDSAVADPATDEYRAVLTVPIGDVGVFQAGSRTPGAFDDDDRELAELLLAHAEEALRRIRFETALQERNRTIERLHETAAELVACEDEPEVLERVLVAAEEVLDLQVCALLLGREADGALEVVAATDDPMAPDVGDVVDGGPNAAWRTYEDGEALLFEDVGEAETPSPHHESYRSAISVPLGDVGVLQAIATEPGAFDENDVELAELLAAQAGEVVSRLRAERRRTDERDRLAALFRNVPEPAVSVAFEDDRAVARAVNPAFENVFGYDEERVVGEDLDRYIVPEGERATAREVNRSAGRGESFHTETTRVTADGERREFLLHVVPVERSPGNPGAYAIYTDITGRKRRERTLREREAELERKNEQLEQFASVVSHDLRNPLSVAQGNLDLARGTGDEEFFENVETAHGRMETLIEDLLALARGGEVTGETERVALSEVARRAWASVDAPAATLSADADAAVEADRERLVQLLENLFRNSVEHGSTSPRGGEDAVEHGDDDVTVTVGTTDDGFFVADDGPGIPLDERERVLEYGYTTADDGTGLGLAIVREIAEGHGWAVEVGESEAGGARFDVLTG